MTELLTYRNFEAGMEDFEKLITQKMVYVDKTSYLEDLLHRAMVTLLLRPRRFGKTLSMSMLSCFLEMNYQHPEDMGRYPVISITLKSIEGSDFAEAMKEMLSLLLELLNKYSFLQKSSKQEEGNKLSLRSMIRICSKRDFRLGNKDNMNAAIDIAKNAMKLLSDMLYAEYEKEAVIIIDEYDVPLQKAKVNGYYDKMLNIEEGRVYSVTTKEDITRGSSVFVELMFPLVITLIAAGTVIFCVVMYLMMGVMIDRAASGISLIKIFGYRPKEIRALYLNGNLLIVAVGALLAVPLAKAVMDAIYPSFICNVACSMKLAFPWHLYVLIFAAVILVYFVIIRLLIGKINRISPAEILKNRE